MYKGIKDVEKWIDDNVFNIHEYSISRSEETYKQLQQSLGLILGKRRKPIKLQKTTGMKDVVIVHYYRSRYGSYNFSFVIYPTPQMHNI